MDLFNIRSGSGSEWMTYEDCASFVQWNDTDRPMTFVSFPTFWACLCSLQYPKNFISIDKRSWMHPIKCVPSGRPDSSRAFRLLSEVLTPWTLDTIRKEGEIASNLTDRRFMHRKLKKSIAFRRRRLEIGKLVPSHSCHSSWWSCLIKMLIRLEVNPMFWDPTAGQRSFEIIKSKSQQGQSEGLRLVWRPPKSPGCEPPTLPRKETKYQSVYSTMAMKINRLQMMFPSKPSFQSRISPPTKPQDFSRPTSIGNAIDSQGCKRSRPPWYSMKSSASGIFFPLTFGLKADSWIVRVIQRYHHFSHDDFQRKKKKKCLVAKQHFSCQNPTLPGNRRKVLPKYLLCVLFSTGIYAGQSSDFHQFGLAVPFYRSIIIKGKTKSHL